MIVKIISAEDTYDIRKKVLRKDIPLPFKFDGDFDKGTLHFGAYVGEIQIGVASFMKVNLEGFSGEHYQLRGMATLTEYQGKGGGRALLNSAEEILKQKKCNMIWCNARIVAQKFYKKNGFTTTGTQFNIKYVGPHYKMYKTIKK